MQTQRLFTTAIRKPVNLRDALLGASQGEESQETGKEAEVKDLPRRRETST